MHYLRKLREKRQRKVQYGTPEGHIPTILIKRPFMIIEADLEIVVIEDCQGRRHYFQSNGNYYHHHVDEILEP